MSKTTCGQELATEIQNRESSGMAMLDWREYQHRLANIGYEIESDSRTPCRAKNMSTGNTYPCVTWGVRERDTKMSAFHVDARRDENFERLQTFRRYTFAVVKGAIYEV